MSKILSFFWFFSQPFKNVETFLAGLYKNRLKAGFGLHTTVCQPSCKTNHTNFRFAESVSASQSISHGPCTLILLYIPCRTMICWSVSCSDTSSLSFLPFSFPGYSFPASSQEKLRSSRSTTTTILFWKYKSGPVTQVPPFSFLSFD